MFLAAGVTFRLLAIPEYSRTVGFVGILGHGIVH
jgi:hypothetical protein